MTSVTGRAVIGEGGPAINFEASLRGMPLVAAHDDIDERFLTTSIASTRVAKDGSFSLMGVPAGDYTLVVTNGPSGRTLKGPFQIAETPIQVRNSPVTGLTIKTAPGAVVRGRVEWEGDGDGLPPSRSPFGKLRATNVGSSLGSYPLDAEVQPDGRFEFTSLFGLTRIESLSLPSKWAITSITAPPSVQRVGANLRFTPGTTVENVTVGVTNRVGMMMATVSDENGNAVTQGSVLLLPVDPTDLDDRGWGFRATQQNYGVNGVRYYVMDGILPGPYLAVAIDIPGAQLSQDSALMERARAAAIRVVIPPDRTQVPLRLLRLQPFVQLPLPPSR